MKTLCIQILVMVALPFVAWSFEAPRLTGPVVDRGGMFSPSAAASVDSFIRAVHSKGGAQLQVLTVPDLQGMAIEQASIETVEQWKLGTQEGDRGVLLMFAKKERKMRIEVGQGLEGDLTDIASKRIIDNVITPYFKTNKFDQGLKEGVVAILNKTDPQIVAASVNSPPSVGRRRANYFPYFIVALFILNILFGGRGGGSGSFLGFLLGTAIGRGGRSGGGWSGGGGGFSGGGASGGW